MDLEATVSRARQTAHSRWVDRAARIGFLAKGAVSAIIGVFALRVAFGDGGAFLDTKGATRVVATQPFGTALLALLGAGLACHALWLVVRAALDPGGDPTDRLRPLKRIGWAVGSLLYGFFSITAFQTIVGARPGGARSWIQMLLSWDGGRWIVVALGLIIVGVGVHQLHLAYTGDFRRDLDLGRMSSGERTWACRAGRFGIAARGAVLPIVGWFFIHAGLKASAAKAGGTGAALREIASQSWGTVLVGVVAAGFVVYAFYMAVNARFHVHA